MADAELTLMDGSHARVPAGTPILSSLEGVGEPALRGAVAARCNG